MADVEGTVADGWEPVAEAFRANFAEHGDVGAGAAIYFRGDLVVDLWGGVADAETGRPWTSDTLQLVFSTTKGATAMCAHLLAQRGELDLDAPVVTYWPEFGAQGKTHVPVRWLLCHKAGLPVIDTPLTFADVQAWTPVVDALAAQAPIWEPGTAHGYHAMTYGWLVGEIVRRVSGRSLGTFFRDEIAGPLGLDFHIGLAEVDQARAASLVQVAPAADADPAVAEMMQQFLGPESLTGQALMAPNGVIHSQPGGFDNPEVRACELPAANGMTTARSLAKLYASTVTEVDGVRLLGDQQVADLRTVQADGPDKVIIMPMTWGSGFMLGSDMIRFTDRAGFGHAGFGGSLGFADPTFGIGFGYVMNKLKMGLAGDMRSQGLIRAARRCAKAAG